MARERVSVVLVPAHITDSLAPLGRTVVVLELVLLLLPRVRLILVMLTQMGLLVPLTVLASIVSTNACLDLPQAQPQDRVPSMITEPFVILIKLVALNAFLSLDVDGVTGLQGQAALVEIIKVPILLSLAIPGPLVLALQTQPELELQMETLELEMETLQELRHKLQLVLIAQRHSMLHCLHSPAVGWLLLLQFLPSSW